MEDIDKGGNQVNTCNKSEKQKLQGEGQQNGSEKQYSDEKTHNDFNVSARLSDVGNMVNSFLDTAMEDEYVQNLTGSVQNLFPKNFQNLTGSMFCDDSSPQRSENFGSSLPASRTSGLEACSQNEQSDMFLANTAPASKNDNGCKDTRYRQHKSKTVNCLDHENYQYIQTPVSQRQLAGQGQGDDKLLPGSKKWPTSGDRYVQTPFSGRSQDRQEFYDDMLSSGSPRFSPLQEQLGYAQTPRSRRILLKQEQCEGRQLPGSQRISPPQEHWRDTKSPSSWSHNDCGTGDSRHTQQEKNPVNRKEKKEKKSITTKTFAHGMMDVSLLTSNATQLRAVLSNPKHEFYNLLLWLIGLSIVLQLLSAVLLIASDFLKTQVKEKDRKNQGKRKFLNFLSLTLVTIVMSLNVLISAFSSPAAFPQQLSADEVGGNNPAYSSPATFTQQVSSNEVNDNVPAFSSPDFQTARPEL